MSSNYTKDLPAPIPIRIFVETNEAGPSEEETHWIAHSWSVPDLNDRLKTWKIEGNKAHELINALESFFTSPDQYSKLYDW